MKTFTVWRDDRPCSIAELGFWDLFWLLLGRELPVMWVTPALPSVIRIQPNYAAFNIGAGEEQMVDLSEMSPPARTHIGRLARPVAHPEPDADLRKRIIAAMPEGDFPMKLRAHTAIGAELDGIAGLYRVQRYGPGRGP